MILSEIWIYPIKSLGGISISSSKTLTSGLELDRRFMLIDEADSFITQRQNPQLATLGVQLKDGFLHVFAKQNPDYSIDIPLEIPRENHTISSIWKSRVNSFVAPKELNDWFSDYLSQKIRIVSMDIENMRRRTLNVAPYKTDMSFADGYPYLALSKESVHQLNSEITEEIDIRQFRANLIFEQGKAFQEDNMKKFSIGTSSFRMVKPCVRCQVITINQDTGSKSKEPLAHLSKTRNKGNGVIFGMNAALLSEGVINVGDNITEIMK